MRLTVDSSETVGIISPLWFGHNLEHTRSCMWRGLSAQLIRNRKFAGMPQQHSGAAQDWYRIGPPAAWHLVELPPTKWDPGTTGQTYTRHFDQSTAAQERASRAHACGRQRIQTFTPGIPAGIGQDGIHLEGGAGYEGRVALLADHPLRVSVSILSSTGAAWHSSTLAVGEAWQLETFSFVAPETDEDARIEITFDEPGALYVGAVSLLPEGHFHGLRPDVVALLKEISTPLLRWPGGNFADNYHWMDGLLPVDQRAPLRGHFQETLPHTHDFDMHELGTDEFIALCREIGAEPFITINLGLEGPAEAAAWVEYCNGGPETKWGQLRAERGHPAPYNVKYWSLGNEYGYGHMLGPNDPEGYRRVVTECASLMRAVDPSLNFTVCGIWWDEAWHEEVMAKIGSSFENVSFHDYTRLMREFEGEAGCAEFRRVAVEAPAAIFNQVANVRKLVDAHAPQGKPIGISFDEWNVWYAWYRNVGVAEGIYTGSMLHNFCRQAQALGITMGAFFEPVNEGAILVRPDGAELTAMGQVFRLLKAHQNRAGIVLAAMDPKGDLDAVASYDRAARDVCVSLINRSLDRALDVELRFPSAVAGEQARGTLLSSADFLPGSRFMENPLASEVLGDGGMCVSLPPCSVALLRVAEAS